jgi:hypothetical protein
MELFLAWLALSVVAGVIASQKGRSGFGFFFLSVLLSPLVGIVAALVAGPNVTKVEQSQIESGLSKKCPFCAEIIKQEARVCRYCGRELESTDEPDASALSGGDDLITEDKSIPAIIIGVVLVTLFFIMILFYLLPLR